MGGIRRRPAVETQHQTIAGGRELGAVVRRHGDAQRGEVRVARRFVCVVAALTRQLC
jgi:hypothetical protein